MTPCFKDHECDTQTLNQNTIPFSECKTEVIELYGAMTEVTTVPVLTCEGIWRILQREAEDIVAPGGVLIADPVERNRAINAAYARLWLHDPRFQWAGLAAFASKQVGCGLLHAARTIDGIQKQHDAGQRWAQRSGDEEALREYQQAADNNPLPFIDFRDEGEPLSLVQQQFQHVYEMLAMGNTSLFLDVFPLHAFFAKRGFAELKECLSNRASIYGHPKFPVMWPVGQERLRFGEARREVLQAFEAMEKGEIALSVEHMATHEQINVLQPAIYENSQFARLLRGNHLSYVTGIPSGVAQAIELTLASQCKRVEDGRTIDFGNNPIADLSDITQRMTFVLRAAVRFDELLNGSSRNTIEQSIRDIAAGVGVR